MRRTKVSQIYREAGDLRAVQLLPGHIKMDSTIFSPGLLVVFRIVHSSVVTDEPTTLFYQIALFGPIGADGRHADHSKRWLLH